MAYFKVPTQHLQEETKENLKKIAGKLVPGQDSNQVAPQWESRYISTLSNCYVAEGRWIRFFIMTNTKTQKVRFPLEMMTKVLLMHFYIKLSPGAENLSPSSLHRGHACLSTCSPAFPWTTPDLPDLSVSLILQVHSQMIHAKIQE